MSVLAIVPARSGSKGIPGKNWRKLGGKTLVKRALDVAREVCETAVLASDTTLEEHGFLGACRLRYLRRPPELAQDDTPMIDVVKHVLEQVPGPDDQIIVLLQPTAVFRTAVHVQQAIALLRETQADSVVSVVELPKTHSPDMVCEVIGGHLRRWNQGLGPLLREAAWPATRQSARTAYMRDGTCYCFWRSTVSTHGTVYGQDVRPLIIPAAETCELDTLEQWAEVERRWHATR